MPWVEMEDKCDRAELFYEDGPTTIICATVDRLMTDQDEGMGVEIEDCTACCIEITVDEPSDIDPKQFCSQTFGSVEGKPFSWR
jgi:hypothetical protein